MDNILWHAFSLHSHVPLFYIQGSTEWIWIALNFLNWINFKRFFTANRNKILLNFMTLGAISSRQACSSSSSSKRKRTKGEKLHFSLPRKSAIALAIVVVFSLGSLPTLNFPHHSIFTICLCVFHTWSWNIKWKKFPQFNFPRVLFFYCIKLLWNCLI